MGGCWPCESVWLYKSSFSMRTWRASSMMSPVISFMTSDIMCVAEGLILGFIGS